MKRIDKLIQESKLKSNIKKEFLEWIEYSNIKIRKSMLMGRRKLGIEAHVPLKKCNDIRLDY